MKITSNWLLACVGIIALSMAGCTDRREGAQPEQPGATPRMGDLGQESTEESAADVSSQREVVERETETTEESVPTVMTGTEKADINRMDTKDFVALGLPEDSAIKITDYRDEHGEFASVDDLSRIPGIDPSWLQQNRDRLGVGTQQAGEEGRQE